MANKPPLNEFWDSAPPGQGTFEPAHVLSRPEAAQRYLQHSIAPGNRLASAVRLSMHGEIKIKRWLPFRAEQVIRWDRGMIWRATVRMSGLPIRGSDRLLDGEGTMEWKVLGLIPIMTASGLDITRSAAGRAAVESIWLPSALCSDDVAWTVLDSSHLTASFTVQNESAKLSLAMDDDGGLMHAKLPRWGNPEGAEFHYVDFGGLVEEEGTFGGFTIPTRLRAGWYFGSGRFESEGEFFRVQIDDATYR